MTDIDEELEEVRGKFLENLARNIDDLRRDLEKLDASGPETRARRDKEISDLNDMLNWARSPNRPPLPPIDQPGGQGSNVGRYERTTGIGQPR